jgi:hypothetical protein
MITYETLSEIRIKTPNGIKIIPPGKIFETSNIKTADSLIKNSKIKVISTDIYDSSAKQSPQSLQCPQTQEKQIVKPADIEKIKSAKSVNDISDSTSMNIFSKSGSQNEKSPCWSDDMIELIQWFQNAHQLSEPFLLSDAVYVAEPQKFYASLQMDIQTGPSAPRNKHGVLMDDLKKLKIVIDGYNTDQSNDKKCVDTKFNEKMAVTN